MIINRIIRCNYNLREILLEYSFLISLFFLRIIIFYCSLFENYEIFWNYESQLNIGIWFYMYCIEKKNTELAGKKMRNMSRASNCAYLLRIESRIHLVHKSRQMYRKRRHICVKFRSTINYFLNRRIIAIELHKITSYGFKIG